jgi:hypothetical protein
LDELGKRAHVLGSQEVQDLVKMLLTAMVFLHGVDAYHEAQLEQLEAQEILFSDIPRASQLYEQTW